MSSYAIRPECFPPVCGPWASRIACHRSVRCAPHFLVNPALATVFPTQGRGARETRKRAVLTATGERGARLTGRIRGCPCQKARGGMGHGPSKNASKWKGGARGWPCGVRERVFRIGPIRHCISDRAIYFDMPTCRHADMLDKGITGLFGTASERHILMEGVRGGSPSGHMPSGQTRGVSGGRRISCPGSAPPWLPCPSPSPGCRARRGAPARCPGYPPDTPWCSGRGAWRGFAGTWR